MRVAATTAVEVIRAARLGFSLMLAISGGPPAPMASNRNVLAELLSQRALEKFGRPPLPVGVRSPGAMPGLTHDQLMTNIDLYGRQVIPRVRELLS